MKILIFTSSSGNGHNSTAKRIKEKVLDNDPNAEIEIVDIYKSYTSKFKAWIMEQGYFFSCNHLVNLYNYYFKKSEKSTPDNRDRTKANRETYVLLHGMLDTIYSFQPDVIVSTYIFASIAITNLKRYYTIPAKTICMTLDYGISPYWECCTNGLDYMFLTSDYMKKRFIELGYTEEQLIVSGIPVADNFFVNKSKEESRRTLGLHEDLFTLIVMKASFFPIKNRDLLREFSKIKQKIQIVIINGKDKKSQDYFDKKLTSSTSHHNIINIGFTNDIVDYLNSANLVLGKAGGLSTTEQISLGKPSLIVDKLPQQEIYNKHYLIENNCALAVNKHNIAETINLLMQNEKLYEELSYNALRIRKEYPLNKICEVIMSCPKADYNNIVMTDSKRRVIRNIDRKRKESIRNTRKMRYCKKGAVSKA